MEQAAQWHRARGFQGLGYHFFCEWDGTRRIGRPVWKMGAHAKGANHDSIGICLSGDNTKADEHWTREQKRTLVLLVLSLWDVFGPLDVVRHCDVGTTATVCPGISDDEWHAITTPMWLNGRLPVMGGE